MAKRLTKRLESLKRIAERHGTPVFVLDHDRIRDNYREFTEALPRVQAYYAVKANSLPEIVRTLYRMGSSFDVASFPEFMIVYENIRNMPAKKRQDWIWDKVIYANTIKQIETLHKLDQFKPLVTFDNIAELHKTLPAYKGPEYRLDGRAFIEVRRPSGRSGRSYP